MHDKYCQVSSFCNFLILLAIKSCSFHRSSNNVNTYMNQPNYSSIPFTWYVVDIISMYYNYIIYVYSIL